MKVSDYMTHEVITANLRDGLYQTWERMHERDIRHMPVLDDGGSVVGIISDRDVRRPAWVDAPNERHDFAIDNSTQVQHAMSEGLLTVEATDSVARAIDIVLERKVGALPVFTGTKLVGIISTMDLLRAARPQLAD